MADPPLHHVNPDLDADHRVRVNGKNSPKGRHRAICGACGKVVRAYWKDKTLIIEES